MSVIIEIFTNSAPLGRVGHRVAMSVCMSGCLCAPSSAVFSQASHWPWGHMISSRPLIGPPSLPPLETWKLGDSETRTPPQKKWGWGGGGDHWEAWNWSCDLRANERPRKKLHSMAQTDRHTHTQIERQTDMATLWPTRPTGAELVKRWKKL